LKIFDYAPAIAPSTTESPDRIFYRGSIEPNLDESPKFLKRSSSGSHCGKSPANKQAGRQRKGSKTISPLDYYSSASRERGYEWANQVETGGLKSASNQL
jgi:hypothetical protein